MCTWQVLNMHGTAAGQALLLRIIPLRLCMRHWEAHPYVPLHATHRPATCKKRHRQPGVGLNSQTYVMHMSLHSLHVHMSLPWLLRLHRQQVMYNSGCNRTVSNSSCRQAGIPLKEDSTGVQGGTESAACQHSTTAQHQSGVLGTMTRAIEPSSYNLKGHSVGNRRLVNNYQTQSTLSSKVLCCELQSTKPSPHCHQRRSVGSRRQCHAMYAMQCIAQR
jgi:hypothetical protein